MVIHWFMCLPLYTTIPLLLFQEPFAKLHNRQQFGGNYESWTQMQLNQHLQNVACIQIPINSRINFCMQITKILAIRQCLPSIIFLNIFRKVSKFRASPNDDVDRLGNTGPVVSLYFNLCSDCTDELLNQCVFTWHHIYLNIANHVIRVKTGHNL